MTVFCIYSRRMYLFEQWSKVRQIGEEMTKGECESERDKQNGEKKMWVVVNENEMET